MFPSTPTASVLVSDFDGTMTRHDFYKLATEQLIPGPLADYWSEYRSGAITHFEALRRYFAQIRADEATVRRTLEQMELDPRLSDAVAALRAGGWEIVIASAGCRWYIDALLGAAGVEIAIHANPGRFETGKGLLMELPPPSPYRSETHGVDKAAVVRGYLAQGRRVAFAGDGFPDLEPARLVAEERRFARGDLAASLRAEGLGFHPFETWSQISTALLEKN